MRLLLDEGARALAIYDVHGRLLYETSFSLSDPASIVCLSKRVCVVVETAHILLLEVVEYPSFIFLGDLILEGSRLVDYQKQTSGLDLRGKVRHLLSNYFE